MAFAAVPLDALAAGGAPGDPGWFARVLQILQALMALSVIGLTVTLAAAAIVLARRSRQAYRRATALLDRVQGDVAPIALRARHVLENLDEVSTAVRADVQRVSALVARAEQRVEGTLARAEARARDLEALLDVAQAQAEDSFVAAASTVAGVRGGIAALRESLGDPADDDGGREAGDDADDAPDAEPGDEAELLNETALVDVDQAPLRDADVTARPRIRTRGA